MALNKKKTYFQQIYLKLQNDRIGRKYVITYVKMQNKLYNLNKNEQESSRKDH